MEKVREAKEGDRGHLVSLGSGKTEAAGEDGEEEDERSSIHDNNKGSKQTTASRSGNYSREPSMLAMRDSERGGRKAGGDGF